MGQGLPPDQIELYRRTDEVLHYIWDPIGISGTPDARNEYYRYLPVVFELLLKQDESGIRSYLLETTENHIGLGLSAQVRARIERTTTSLVEWRLHCIGT